MVEERGRVLPRRRDLPGFRRRRLRRPVRPHRSARLPRGPRRQLPVADALLPQPAARRRLRHHRLLRRRRPARHPGRLRRDDPDRGRSRHPRDRRPRRQPQLRSASVVPVRARPRVAVSRLLRLGGREAGGEARRRRVPRSRGLQLGLRPEGPAVVPAPLLLPPARPQRRQPRRPRRDRAGRRLLAEPGPGRLPRGRGAVPARADRDARRRVRGPARASCATCAASWAAAAATRS